MKKPKIVLPHKKTRVMYRNMEAILDFLISQPILPQDEVQKLRNVRETLKSIRRLSVRLDAALYAEIIGLIGMTIYGKIDRESSMQAGLVVYPIMLAIGTYIANIMDKLDKMRDIFTAQLNNNQK